MDLKTQVDEILEGLELSSGTLKKLRNNIIELVEQHKQMAKKKLKDPNAPKKPKSAYLIFCHENRATITEEVTKSHKGDKKDLQKKIMQELGSRWKACNEKKKAKYEEKAADEKKKYRKLMEKYIPPSEEELASLPINQKKIRKKGGKKTKKDPNAPKGPKTAYILFSSHKRKELAGNSEIEKAELTKHIANIWQSLSDTEKARWNKEAAADKKRYEKEMAKYKKGKGEDGGDDEDDNGDEKEKGGDDEVEDRVVPPVDDDDEENEETVSKKKKGSSKKVKKNKKKDDDDDE